MKSGHKIYNTIKTIRFDKDTLNKVNQALFVRNHINGTKTDFSKYIRELIESDWEKTYLSELYVDDEDD